MKGTRHFIHKKCRQPYFDAIASGEKNFEIRLADFELHIGDTLILEEFDHHTNSYTGRAIHKRVSWFVRDFDVLGFHWWNDRDTARYGIYFISLLHFSAFVGFEGLCRVCGCTDDHAYEGGCHWVEKDLCSKCAEKKMRAEG